MEYYSHQHDTRHPSIFHQIFEHLFPVRHHLKDEQVIFNQIANLSNFVKDLASLKEFVKKSLELIRPFIECDQATVVVKIKDEEYGFAMHGPHAIELDDNYFLDCENYRHRRGNDKIHDYHLFFSISDAKAHCIGVVDCYMDNSVREEDPKKFHKGDQELVQGFSKILEKLLNRLN